MLSHLAHVLHKHSQNIGATTGRPNKFIVSIYVIHALKATASFAFNIVNYRLSPIPPCYDNTHNQYKRAYTKHDPG